MTEPREPDATLDEGESTTPIETAQPEAAGWYPVPVEPEVEETPVATEAESEASEDSEPTALVEKPAVVDEPTAVVEEPTAVVEKPAVVDEPTAVVDEPTAVVDEPTAVVDEPTAVVEEPTVAIDSEPTGSEHTSVLPPQVVDAPRPPVAVPTEFFRPPSPNTGSSPNPAPTHMEELSDEEQKLAAERAARRDARTAALSATAPLALVAPEPVIVHKRTNDKFWGSVGLFLLRLVLAAVFAVRGLNILTDIPAAQALLARTIIPEPGIMAIVTGVAALSIALSLLLGLLTRLAGLGIALIAGGALALVYWGNWSPFVAGRPGFLGDFELVLAAVGVLLICIGAGGWSLDHSFRAGRARDKAERTGAAA